MISDTAPTASAAPIRSTGNTPEPRSEASIDPLSLSAHISCRGTGESVKSAHRDGPIQTGRASSTSTPIPKEHCRDMPLNNDPTDALSPHSSSTVPSTASSCGELNVPDGAQSPSDDGICSRPDSGAAGLDGYASLDSPHGIYFSPSTIVTGNNGVPRVAPPFDGIDRSDPKVTLSAQAFISPSHQRMMGAASEVTSRPAGQSPIAPSGPSPPPGDKEFPAMPHLDTHEPSPTPQPFTVGIGGDRDITDASTDTSTEHSHDGWTSDSRTANPASAPPSSSPPFGNPRDLSPDQTHGIGQPPIEVIATVHRNMHHMGGLKMIVALKDEYPDISWRTVQTYIEACRYCIYRNETDAAARAKFGPTHPNTRKRATARGPLPKNPTACLRGQTLDEHRLKVAVAEQDAIELRHDILRQECEVLLSRKRELKHLLAELESEPNDSSDTEEGYSEAGYKSSGDLEGRFAETRHPTSALGHFQPLKRKGPRRKRVRFEQP